jgi:hypothetical protein
VGGIVAQAAVAHMLPMRLRPRRSLFRDGLLGAILTLTPVFGVAYWQTIGEPTLPLLIGFHALSTLLVVAASWRYFATGVWVDDISLSERGFLSNLRRFPRAEVTGIVRARTFGHGAEPVHQLFVMGRDDTVLVRLRGQFWSADSMDALAKALAVPVTVLPDVMSTRELAMERPALVYWFERSRLAAAAAIAAIALVSGAVVWTGFALFA